MTQDHITLRPGVALALIPLVVMACAATPHATSPPPIAQTATAKPKAGASASDPSATYHFMLGYQAELAQDTDRAIQEYQSALKSDPNAHAVKARLAGLYFSLGDLSNAVRYAEDAVAGSGQNAQTLSQMAGIFAGAGQPDRAIQLLDRAIEQEPGKADAYFSKGLLLMNQKRLSEAEQSVKQGIALSPDAPVGPYYLGRIQMELSHVEDAIASFERAAAVNAAFEPSYIALASIYESRQEKDKAIAVLRKYLQNVNPRNRDVRNHLVRLYMNAKDYQGALAELDRMVAEDPTDLDAQLRISLVYGELKEYHKAIERLTPILALRPAELKIRDYLGYLYEETKQYPKALDTYRFNLQLDPSYFEGHLHLGVLLYRIKRFQDSISHLAEAAKLNPKQPESYIVMGLAYLQGEQFEQATQAFEEGIRHNPKNADLHFNLGTAYDKLNRFDEVVRAMETALKLDPHHADALNYLGYSYAERGIRIEEAISLTRQAVALKPNNGYYVDSLGWALFKSGQLDQALHEIRRAVELAGDDPVIYEHLGEIHLKKDMHSEAREAWLRSLELDPSNIKLIERFRQYGMGDPAQEERIRQAQRRVSESKSIQSSTP